MRPDIDSILKTKEIQSHIKTLLQNKNIGDALLNPLGNEWVEIDKNQPGLTFIRPYMNQGGSNERDYQQIDKNDFKLMLEKERNDYLKEKELLKQKLLIQNKEIYQLQKEKEKLYKEIESERNLK